MNELDNSVTNNVSGGVGSCYQYILVGGGSLAIQAITDTSLCVSINVGLVSAPLVVGVGEAALPVIAAAAAGYMIGYGISQIPAVQSASDSVGSVVGTFLGNHGVVW